MGEAGGWRSGEGSGRFLRAERAIKGLHARGDWIGGAGWEGSGDAAGHRDYRAVTVV